METPKWLQQKIADWKINEFAKEIESKEQVDLNSDDQKVRYLVALLLLPEKFIEENKEQTQKVI